MKRALPAALGLALAVALLAWFRRDETPTPAPSPALAASSVEAEDQESSALEIESGIDRAEIDAAPAESRPARSTRPPRPAAAAVKLAEVTLRVSFASSGEPVGPALANLLYIDPQAGEKSPVETHRMLAKGDGRFVLDVPVGARLQFADVCGNSQWIQGPRTEHNASSRFHPLHSPLDQLVGDAAVELRLQVVPGREFHGVVRDACSRKSIAGAQLRITAAIGKPIRMDSDPDGRFVLAEWGPDGHLNVQREGYCPLVLTIGPEAFEPQAPELVVLLDPNLSVAGRIVDARGAPVASTKVALYVRRIERASPGRPTRDSWTTSSEADGSFRLEGLTPFEEADLSAEWSSGARIGLLRVRRELGPLHADLDGLVLVIPESTVISIRVALPDGTIVPPLSFFLDCEETFALESLKLSGFDREYLLRVPVGVELHFVAVARARRDDASRMLMGRRTFLAATEQARPPEVRIELVEPLLYEPPPSEAPVLSPYEAEVLATLDLRLLDKSGSPLPGDTRALIQVGGHEFESIHPVDGWIRLRCIPGTQSVRVRIGDDSEFFSLEAPWSGYARLERRLVIGP